MSWNMASGSSPLDYERAEGLETPDETWRNDEDDERMRADEEPSVTRRQFDMVAYANDALRRNAELNRHLRRLYSENEPPRKPAQMELGESTQEDAA